MFIAIKRFKRNFKTVIHRRHFSARNKGNNRPLNASIILAYELTIMLQVSNPAWIGWACGFFQKYFHITKL